MTTERILGWLLIVAILVLFFLVSLYLDTRKPGQPTKGHNHE